MTRRNRATHVSCKCSNQRLLELLPSTCANGLQAELKGDSTFALRFAARLRAIGSSGEMGVFFIFFESEK